VEHRASRLGVVLWPPHLVGNALWQFYVIGEDGLARGVAPDTANALRELYRPLHREMARYAKTHLPSEFPRLLVDRGFAYHGEIGWYQDDGYVQPSGCAEEEPRLLTLNSGSSRMQSFSPTYKRHLELLPTAIGQGLSHPKHGKRLRIAH
jgi:hypothetical protein